MTFLVAAMLLGQPFPTSITARQGKSLDGGLTAWAVDCVSGCSGGGGVASTVSVNVLDAGAPLNINPPATLPLPTGAATGARQDTGNTSLSSIDGKTPTLVSGRQPVDPSGVTSPISAAALPLPSGASTSGLQTTGNTSLSSIDGKLPALAGGKVPVDIGASIVSVTGGLTDTQLRATPVPISGTVTASGPVTDTQLRASAVPVSIASMPSTPVTGAFFQSTQPVSAAALPLPTGAATDSTLSQLLDGGVLARGLAPNGQAVPIAVSAAGVQYIVFQAPPPLNPFLPRCNPVRRTGCQP